ncbi:hypothetical protein [Methylocaldum sp.]|uniref:hypothetical protein n=1 Tax=Methylocaldum sp. TaxID=1969727 RepID=UPI002D328B8B|nr:hypothetical protein [Methylocaldum sp.]HYE36303.1 hypothetical protein [Methylocaldum sp.]
MVGQRACVQISIVAWGCAAQSFEKIYLLNTPLVGHYIGTKLREGNMIKQSVQSVATAMIIGLCQTGLAGEISVPPLTAPEISQVEIDAITRCLIISGTNFGSAQPSVTLGSEILAVKNFSNNRVAAALPPVLRPAAYRLTLTDSHGAGKSDSFPVQIFQPYRNTPRGH